MNVGATIPIYNGLLSQQLMTRSNETLKTVYKYPRKNLNNQPCASFIITYKKY